MSNIQIREAKLNDEEGIVRLLEKFYPGVPNHWRKLFKTRPWRFGNDMLGFVVEDNALIVGFLGVILSEYDLPQERIKICNLTSWYIDPNYRQYTMPHFAKIMRIPNVSWTNLTPALHTLDFLKRMGFQILQDRQTLVLPVPSFSKKNIKIQLNIIEEYLDPNLKNIHSMHKNLCCKQILIKKNNEECYCLIVLTKHKKIPLAKFYYISNLPLFKNLLSEIRFEICVRLGIFYFLVEGDVLDGKKLIGARTIKMLSPRLYKSNYTKENMTLLGSELFILGI